MGHTHAHLIPATTEALHEIYGLYAAGVTILVLRFLVRLRVAGIRNFQGDDYISFIIFALHTADAASVSLVYLRGSNVDYTPDELAEFDHGRLADIIFGSKMELLAWYTYTALTWALKACLLCFFNRLTLGLQMRPFVKALAYACGITYVAVLMTISCACHPIRLNWQVTPYPPKQCTLRPQNVIVSAALNVVTDGAMLCIPMPLLWKLQVPLRKKIKLAIVLSSGVIVITAALVRVVETLKVHPSAVAVNSWGIRETIAGIFAVNMPILAALFTKPFWTGNMPSPTGTAHRLTLKNKTSSGSKSADPNLPGVFEIIEKPRNPPIIGAQSGTPRTTRPTDSNSDLSEDTASADLIIQGNKHTGPSGYEADRGEVEKGKVGASIETKYNMQQFRTAQLGAQRPAHPVRTQSSQHRVYDGRRWHGQGFEDIATISRSSKSEHER
ncbi:hypothetical protein LTR08_003374 [Meristemomyces frigidus]|nr:hypothetical protein LTR08_003374 [Meristemomyces frigidus]